MPKNTGKSGVSSPAGRRDAPAATLMDGPTFRVRLGGATAGPAPPVKNFAGRIKALVRQHGAGPKSARQRAHGGAGGSAAARVPVRAHPQRVIVKARVVRHSKYGAAAGVAKALRKHTNYLSRDGAAEDRGRGVAFNGSGEVDPESLTLLRTEMVGDRHHFRFIVSPENGAALDLPAFARELVTTMEADLGTRLQWVGMAHYDTDEPHVHLLVRGKDARGGDLVINREYLSHGMRLQAMEVATRHLGPRLPQDIERARVRDLKADRVTGLDLQLAEQAALHADGWVSALRTKDGSFAQERQRLQTLARLQYLESLGLAREITPGVWHPALDFVARLKALGRRGDIIKLMHERMTGGHPNFSAVIFNKDHAPTAPVVGRVVHRGTADELSDQQYLLVEGPGSDAYYVPLSEHSEVSGREAGVGALVQMTATPVPHTRPADRTIARFAADHEGIYDAEAHRRAVEVGMPLPPGVSAADYVESHVKRLRALASRGLVEPVGAERFRVPGDLATRIESTTGAARDAGRVIKIERLSAGDFDRQVATPGITWLDRELLRGVDPKAALRVGATRFERDLGAALKLRAEQLSTFGLAQDVEGQWRPSKDLLQRLYARELQDAGRRLSARYGEQVPLVPGRTFTGTVASIEELPSGPHALVSSDDRFTLVPANASLARQVGRTIGLALGRGRGSARIDEDPLARAIRYQLLDLKPTRHLGR